LTTAAAAAVGLVGALVAAWALTGFDPLGSLAATEEVYRVSIARIRPYPYFVFGAPVAWMLALGPPVAVLWLRSGAARRAPALALAAVVVASALAGFTKGETERIWLFLVPLACVAAAPALPRRWLVPVLAMLAVQAFLMQVLLGTVW
jgi:methylthioxylose transferase